MAELGLLEKSQADLAATTLTPVHTCAARYSEKITVFICNRATATTFRLSVAANGAADDVSQYLYYDTVLPANDTFQLELTLTAGDVVRVYGGTTTISVNVFIDESFRLAD
jgi:hypothetical protein